MTKRLVWIPVIWAAVLLIVAQAGETDTVKEGVYRFILPSTVLVAVFTAVLAGTNAGGRKLRSDAFMPVADAKRHRAVLAHDLTQEAVLALSGRDPGFTVERITTHVAALVEVLKRGQLGAVHAWVSDGFFQRLSTQARLVGLGEALEVMQQIGSVRVSQAAIGESYEALTVRVTFAPSGQKPDDRNVVTQSWRLLRRISVKTRTEGLAEGKCPRCGASLQLSATQRCAHCEAIVNSGEYDWVLSDVSPGATTLTQRRDLFDLDGLRVEDPHLAPEELVDRATLAFWRWYEAAATGDVKRLTRLATPGFLSSMRSSLEAKPLANVRIRVGGADARLLRRQGTHDEAHVVVWWHADDGTKDQTVFKLVRPKGSRSAQRLGLASDRCEGCLAPMTNAESPACEHCGRPFTDAWALDALEVFEDWSAFMRPLLQQRGAQQQDWRTVPVFERQRALRLAASVAKADGTVSPPERAMLETLARAWALESGEVDAALANDEPASAAGLTLHRAFARELVRELTKLVFVDRRAEVAERKLVLRVASTLGVAEDARRLIDEGVNELLTGQR